MTCKTFVIGVSCWDGPASATGAGLWAAVAAAARSATLDCRRFVQVGQRQCIVIGSRDQPASRKFASASAIVSADNDVSGAGERAAKAIGRPYFMAPTVGHDANDWHQDAGLMPLCAAIMRARTELEVPV